MSERCFAFCTSPERESVVGCFWGGGGGGLFLGQVGGGSMTPICLDNVMVTIVCAFRFTPLILIVCALKSN